MRVLTACHKWVTRHAGSKQSVVHFTITKMSRSHALFRAPAAWDSALFVNALKNSVLYRCGVANYADRPSSATKQVHPTAQIAQVLFVYPCGGRRCGKTG